MFEFLRRVFREAEEDRRARLMPESRVVVTFDERGAKCRQPSGKTEAVQWDELEAVIVETNDTGPLGTDVYWVLIGRDAKNGCVVPGGATGEQELLERLQQLPGFDNEQLIAAMSCTDNRQFVCWRRPGAEKGET